MVRPAHVYCSSHSSLRGKPSDVTGLLTLRRLSGRAQECGGGTIGRSQADPIARDAVPVSLRLSVRAYATLSVLSPLTGMT